MISIKKIIQRFHETSTYIGKARVLSALRSMDPNWLDEHGYSIAALNRGIEAWPWRKEEQPEAGAASAAGVSTLDRGAASPLPDYAAGPDKDAA